MAKSNTIKIWIDLWTTNSALVYNNNWKFEVIKNSDQLDYTPSIFWFNKGKNPQVGKKAYDQLYNVAIEGNAENYKAEVKRLMGTKETTYFDRVDKDFTAEEISSEILKYLKESLLRKYPDANTDWVVITVPAYFSTTQNEATKRAGKLAWFKHVVLLQEPIAWALAYWYDNEVNENWLVYDLWWWTFDVAIISSNDWVLTVKGHAWDNYLWWKDFDNLIIDKVLKPEWSDLDFSDRTIRNSLKWIAESAKKELTDISSVNISWDIVDIYEEVELTRDRFEELISKKIDDSIELCENAIKESWLTKNDINKIILVGWPTQIPYIRKRIESALGIKVDSSMDPLTVVAKGACIFWDSQIIPKEDDEEIKQKKASWDLVHVDLNYESVVSDTDTMVTGKIHGLDEDTDYYIQIQSEDWSYASNKIKLKNGKFFDTVSVKPKQSNVYFLYLSDNDWNIVEIDPDSFVITHWVSIAGTPLSRSIAVALNKKTFTWEAEDYCEVIFERGMILPLEKEGLVYHTSRALMKWDHENWLPIRIYEWESKKPDRNTFICEVKVSWKDIPYNLPEGTEVELTVKVDASWEVSLSAYFPDIDYTIEQVWRSHHDEKIENKWLVEDIKEEKERFAKMSQHLPDEERRKIRDQINELSEWVDSDDEDTKRKTQEGIKKLKQRLDKYEWDTESSRVIEEFRNLLPETKKLMWDLRCEDQYEDQYDALKREGEKCIDKKDWERLKWVIEDLRSLWSRMFFNTPMWLKSVLTYLYDKKDEATDQIRANQIFNKALWFMQENNMDGMRQCIQEISQLMPRDVQQGMWNFSWITK